MSKMSKRNADNFMRVGLLVVMALFVTMMWGLATFDLSPNGYVLYIVLWGLGMFGFCMLVCFIADKIEK